MAALGFSDYISTKLADHVLGDTPFTTAGTLYMRIYTTMPNQYTGAGGTELATTGTGYTGPIAITNDTTNFPNATGSNGTITKAAAAITLFTTESSLSIAGWALWDASSSGNLYFSRTFPTVLTVSTGTPLSFATGDLQIIFDSNE